jgi:hypothetical protein
MPGAAMLERVRPWCELGAVRSTKSEETRVAKALQTSDLWPDGSSPTYSGRPNSCASFAVETTFSSRSSKSIERTLLNWLCW